MTSPGQDELDNSVDKGLTIVECYQTHISKINEWVQINNGTNKSTSKQQFHIYVYLKWSWRNKNGAYMPPYDSYEYIKMFCGSQAETLSEHYPTN